jgi:hypothetical protein
MTAAAQGRFGNGRDAQKAPICWAFSGFCGARIKFCLDFGMPARHKPRNDMLVGDQIAQFCSRN